MRWPIFGQTLATCIHLIVAVCNDDNLNRPIDNIGQSIIINSPGYPPGPYPNNQNCSWYVHGPVTSVLKVQSIFFDVEGYTDACYFDNLHFDEIAIPPVPPSRKFCAPRTTVSYTTKVYQMFIRFQSDDQIVRFGFSLNITAINKPPPTTTTPTTTATTTQRPTRAPNLCDQMFFANASTFSMHFYSPNYPDTYPNNIFCAIGIQNLLFNQNQSVQLTFISFETEHNFDILRVLTDSIEEEYSGIVTSGFTKVYKTSYLVLSFDSDFSINFQGFDLLVELVPQPFICPPDAFLCPNTKLCVTLSKLCDGKSDCLGMEDENTDYCQVKPICGTSKIKPNINIPAQSQRIGGGVESKPGSWPWTVAVISKLDETFVCTGTLLDFEWIVTAASCFAMSFGNPRRFAAQIGSHHVGSMDAPWQINADLMKIELHPNFNAQTNKNNIAMIRLAAPLTLPFNDRVNVACLPDYNEDLYPGKQCVTTGWGQTDIDALGSSPDSQQEALLTILSQSNCTMQYPGQILPDMFCAGGQPGVGYCAGDEGSPLVCKNAGKWVLEGIVSFGRVCGQQAGVYQRINSQLSFILGKLNIF